MTSELLRPDLQADPVTRQTKKAAQLLVASARHSYDPLVDIDWDAPLVEGKWFLAEKRCSLYGTELWDSLGTEQRMLLSREELAASVAVGVWTEHVLLHLVSRYVYKRDVSTPQVQFALTEVADEVRHMIMFAKLVEKIGAEIYPTPPKTLRSGLLLKTFAPVPALWALILLTEEFFDRFQREQSGDETIQPVVRAVARIHVVEEARHISFARTELERFVPTLSGARLGALRRLLAGIVAGMRKDRYNPLMYQRAGLDPKTAIAAARANPNNIENAKYGGQRIAAYYHRIGLIGGPTEKVWREAGWLS
ncbi:diiron oxygenase [Streptomyces sp. NPDC058864]